MKTIQILASATALIGTLLLQGCQRNPVPQGVEPSGITSQQFVTAYVDLWRARTTATTAEQYEEQKRQILERAAVSERALQLFAAEHAHDLPYMAAVWDSVQNRLNSPTGEIVPE